MIIALLSYLTNVDGAVAKPVILAAWMLEVGRITVQEQQHRQKILKTASQQKKLDVVVHACHPSFCGKHEQED
jgi:hypothetical protein